MSEILKTPLHEKHVQLGAHMAEFAGWDMPINYPSGIFEEHLATRKRAGMFDVSHMGRLRISGSEALPFLQHVLTNNAAALEEGLSQYTLIPNETGGAIDDAYLYRFDPDAYLLVVNAANRIKDLDHLRQVAEGFGDVELEDLTTDIGMISLQGPTSKEILAGIIEEGVLPEPMRNALSDVVVRGAPVRIARTGYTGEPLCFELFVPSDDAGMLWDLLAERGAVPVGLGARDTLRLEAGLPLYGHELGVDPDGHEIPLFAIPLARFAVSFSSLKGDFIGREPLRKQFEVSSAIMRQDFADMEALPRRIRAIALAGPGVARAGSVVYRDDAMVGWITSGTVVPYWEQEGVGLASTFVDDTARRAIGLALLDSDLLDGDRLEVDIRGKRREAVIVPYHLRSEAPPYTRPITYEQLFASVSEPSASTAIPSAVRVLLDKAVQNTEWRQHECINLIPSEQSPSVMTRLLSITDPVCRYAEHKQMKAFNDLDVFFYQGTGFIAEVEMLLEREMQRFLGCAEVESRVVSGQMANTAVFSAMVDYLNRTDRKSEQRRMRKIMNNHIIRGGHLSAQPMGALRDFVARDPRTERPAVVNFPVLPDNPYKMDVEACRRLFEEERPELVILGKSMVLYREPVAELRTMIDAADFECVLMYDMAHVLGLVGPHFQEPFSEGADLVTGSTHKTFFGTQRGVVGGNFREEDAQYPLWEAVRRRAFPGSVSNHHLGTLVGLLMAAYEMNHFKDAYQRKVLSNAKAFARALHDCGLHVAGDPADSFTETHQAVVEVGYAKGPEVAQRLEENNIIVNYQATPEEEGFTASAALRMGVSEMTRFGMEEADFGEVAQMIHDVVLQGRNVKKEVAAFRKRFRQMHYCFSGDEYDGFVEKLHRLL
jgi:aminomethyltransferase